MLAGTGDVEAATRLGLWSGDWEALDPSAAAPWRETAEHAKPLPTDAATGPLGRGSQSIDASAASRTAIEALLASVPSPDNS
jgi:hypothetical protein